MDDLTKLTVEALQALAADKRTAFTTLAALDEPTEEQVVEAEALAADIDTIDAELAQREEATAALAARRQALKDRKFAADAADADADAGDGGDDGDDDDDDDGDGGDGSDAGDGDGQNLSVDGVVVKTAAADVKTLSSRVRRPAPPVVENKPVKITAQADVPGFATSSALDMDQVSEALVARMQGFGVPTGNGQSENLQHYGVAQFRLDFPEDLVIDRGKDDMEVLARARQERRLPGNSLTASGGWCAPSETLYDLCTTETTEGILSVPEVAVKRGGVKFTSGPDFSAVYNAASGFDLTEAQVISGTTKGCFEVPCPSFTDVRLDAVGICIKAPILTNAAYPELVRRWVEGTMIAHQHRVNAKIITAMATAAGAARVWSNLGTTAGDTLDSLELVAETLREKYRMGLAQTMEVVLPNWSKGALRADLQKRMGQENPVTDQQLSAHFAARNLNVSFVYDWQMLATPDTLIAYPTTFQALLYPAGTFVKGTADVITMNAVYDAASLAANIYTAIFMEQGVSLMKMCNQAALVTIGVCNSGRIGAANFTCS